MPNRRHAETLILEGLQLGKRYVRADREIWPVRGVTIHAHRGELLTLVGRSGTGKSTLINMLLGLLTPDEGNVLFEGESLNGLSDGALSRLRNCKMGYVPQSVALLPTLTVHDNVRLPWYLSQRGPEPIGRAASLLAEVGLAGFGAQRPEALSGGELRRVAVARALMTEPLLLVADEPTASLDKESAEAVMGLLRKAADRGMAVLTVTHDPVGVELSDRILQMANGALSPIEEFPRSGLTL